MPVHKFCRHVCTIVQSALQSFALTCAKFCRQHGTDDSMGKKLSILRQEAVAPSAGICRFFGRKLKPPHEA